MSNTIYTPDELRAVIDEVLTFAKAHNGKLLGDEGWKELDRLDEKAWPLFEYFGLTAPEVHLLGGIMERRGRMKFPMRQRKAPPECPVTWIMVIEDSAEWFQGMERLKTTEKPTPEATHRNEQKAKEEAAREKLAELISRSIGNINEFRTWLNDAEAFTRSLPDNRKNGTEKLNTHNSGELRRVAERLHDLANEHTPEAAARCMLPGRPTHFSKAEVLGNLRLLTKACPSDNAYSELTTAAVRYGEEESERLQSLIAQFPLPGHHYSGRLESWPQTQARLRQWQSLVDAALRAADGTGFSVEEVDRRVNALDAIVRKILLWQRDRPALYRDESTAFGVASGTEAILYTVPRWTYPASKYLCDLREQLNAACDSVRSLAVRLDCWLAGAPATQTTTVSERADVQESTETPEDGILCCETTPDGFLRIVRTPDETAEQFHQHQLELYLGAVEQWRADLVEKTWLATDSKTATTLAYKANAYERELWPETPKLLAGRTFLVRDLAPMLERLRERILGALSCDEPDQSRDTWNGIANVPQNKSNEQAASGIGVGSNGQGIATAPPSAPPKEIAAWSSGIFLAKAQEICRRLRCWEGIDYLVPIHIATEAESREWVRRTFREYVKDDRQDRPTPGFQLYRTAQGMVDENGIAGQAYENVERLEDKSLTQFLLADFYRHLNAAQVSNALDYLKETFEQILRLPAWTVRRPKTEGESAMLRGEPRYMVEGLRVPPELLDALVDAGKRLMEGAMGKSEPSADPEWTPPDSPQRWAKLFDFSVDTLKRRFDDGTIRHKKLSSKRYQIAVDDLPAIHQTKFRNGQNPPAK